MEGKDEKSPAAPRQRWEGYEADMETVCNRVKRLAEAAGSEADTAAAFETELFFLIRARTGYAPVPRKEQRVDGLRHDFAGARHAGSRSGRMDAVVNGLVIEYKHWRRLLSDAEQAKAYEQVAGYLRALRLAKGAKHAAILTDGLQVAYFDWAGDGVAHTALKPLAASDFDTLVQAILSNGDRRLVPENIVADFAISPTTASPSKEVATALLNQLTSTMAEKTGMLYAEWKALMHLSVFDNGKSRDIEKRREALAGIFGQTIADAETEYKALFALQTTYSLIVKLIACRIIEKAAPAAAPQPASQRVSRPPRGSRPSAKPWRTAGWAATFRSQTCWRATSSPGTPTRTNGAMPRPAVCRP